MAQTLFFPGGISFLDYPFAPASVYPSATVLSRAMRAICLKANPPEVWLHTGEILFLDARQKEVLGKFAERNRIPTVEANLVWSMILDEFLDTEFGPESIAGSYRYLEKAGIPRDEVDRLRKRLAPIMMSYNFDSCLWEWVNLGLYDLLSAMNGALIAPRLKPSEEEFQAFYWEAMRLAERSFRR